MLAVVAVGCGSAARTATTTPSTSSPSSRSTSRPRVAARLVSPLRLPLVRSRILPGYLLVADRNNNRVLILAPDKRIVWQVKGLRQPDDAFFTPGFRSVITNEEFNDTLSEISLASKRTIWTYGHTGVPGRSQCPARARRQVHARSTPRLREPERRHAAPRRRVARHRDRRLGRPPRLGRQARLVGALACLVPVGRAAPAERAPSRLRLHHARPRRGDDADRPRCVVFRGNERRRSARPAVACDPVAERPGPDQR